MKERHLLSVSGNLFKSDKELLDYIEVEKVSRFLEDTIAEYEIELAIVIGGP